MRKKLKVTPARRYRTPRYPSYLDESPLLMSRNVSKTGYYATAFLGVFGLFAFSASSNDTSTGEVKENPIKFKELGFPHTYASFGTGLPDRLDRETAVEIIDSIFLANKIELTEGYPISKDGLNFKATGYNKKHNIGYVWLDYESTGPDCYNSWRNNRYNNASLLPEDLVAYKKLTKEVENKPDGYKIIDDFLRKLTKQKGYYKLLELERHLWRDKILKDKINRYIKENTNYTDENYGKEILDAYENEKVDLKEMEQIPNEEGVSIAALSQYDHKFEYYPYREYVEDKNGNLVEKEGEARQKAIENLENLVQDYIDWAKSEGRY
ncbi:hypothetical protein [uncultured Kordia sp.]|uniref:hypothetical protein n=1 Tax=uncultured Kordia sp. TaxID=507699 RepID=UPI00260F7952|nr:hypothetical protein [uncultured Kordia sp.]